MSAGLPPAGSRIAIYARFSTHNQTEASIVRQVTNASEFAESNGWIVVGVYDDPEKSGTTFVGRTGFLSMMLAVEKGEFEGIVVEDISRLSRKSGDIHGLFDELTEMGVWICTVSAGRLVEDVDVMVGAYKNAKDVSEAKYRSRAGQVTAVEAGRNAGAVAYGYRKVLKADGKNGHREIDPERADIVRRLFDDTLLGMSPKQICTALNREGDPGPRGKGWLPGTLVGARKTGGGMLRNRAYAGYRIYGRTEVKSRKGVKTSTLSPPGQMMMRPAPELKIVDPHVFDQVQALLDEKSGPANRYKKFEYPFSGKYKCGHCGESMILLSGRLACKGRRLMGIDCPNSVTVPRVQLENYLLAGMAKHLLKPEFIDPVVSEFRAEADRAFREFVSQREADLIRFQELDERIADLLQLVGDRASPMLAKQALMRQLDVLEGERQRLNIDIGRRPPGQPANLSVADIISNLTNLLNSLATTLMGNERDASLARATMRSMVETITLTPDLASAIRPGHGTLSIRVEGSLTNLLNLGDTIASVDITHSFGAKTMRDVGQLKFILRFPMAVAPGRFSQIAEDVPAIAEVLCRNQNPVGMSTFMQALQNGADERTPDPPPILQQRVEKALRYLKERQLVSRRNINLKRYGWRWAEPVPFWDGWDMRSVLPCISPPTGLNGERLLQGTADIITEQYRVIAKPSAFGAVRTADRAQGGGALEAAKAKISICNHQRH